MEEINDAIVEKPSFFSYIFNFDNESKCEIMNMLQYTILSIIPILLILKSMKFIVPEEDETKGSLEIAAECLLQVIFIVVSLWFSNRLVRYIPTYSGCEYTSYDSLNFLLPLIFVLLTMQTKLGAKINILMERLFASWNGTSIESNPVGYDSSKKIIENNTGQIRITQPIATSVRNKSNRVSAPSYNPNGPNTMDNTNLLPNNLNMTTMPQTQNNPMDYDEREPMETLRQQTMNISNNDMNTMQNNMGMGMGTGGLMDNEPMAANEVGGFSAW